MKVLVTGPRIWLDQKSVEAVLSQLPQDTVLIHGGARGLDTIAGYVASTLGMGVRKYSVDHNLDGPWPAAGHRRNQRMLKSEHPWKDGSYIDLGLVFKLTENLSKGTANMAGLLRSAVPTMNIKEIWWTKSGFKAPESLVF